MSSQLSASSLPRSARIVIIGGGIVGCSTAYHLAQKGWRDMVLLDQGPLFENWGSTSHAPGLMFQHNNSSAVTRLAQWAIDTYKTVAPHARMPAFFQVGSIEIAATKARAIDLRRKIGNAMSWGLDAHLIDNQEISRLIPIMRTDDLHGAFYVPSDADVKAYVLCEAMARLCQEKGALQVFERTSVTSIEVKNGQVRAVVTPEGRIEADIILCAAGIWGPRIGRMVGVPIPLTPMQHLYLRTEPLPELAGESVELRHPIVRDQDRDMYYRQHLTAYGYGTYNHQPLPVDVDAIPHRDNAAMLPFTPQHAVQSVRDAFLRFPCLARAPIAKSFNGLFSFTPDANSILGETPGVRGFWVAEAVWVTQGGGVGKVMANWIADGAAGIDLREMDINRFHRHAHEKKFVLARSCQQYAEVYDIVHPLDPPSVARNLRLAPYHARLESLGANWFETAGWERPRWFASNQALLDPSQPGATRSDPWSARNWSPIIAAEHQACRTQVGLFDLTPFAKFEVTGEGALPFLQFLTANQMDKPVGSVIYTAMLTERGGIKCDLTVTRLAEERFWIITGGGMAMHDLAWIRRHALPHPLAVNVTDLSSAYCSIGVWGPRARDLMELVSDDAFSNDAFPYLTAREVSIGIVPAIAIRISYAGELGWEIYAPAEFGLKLWDQLWEAGISLGAAAVGVGAFDSLRIEKGYRLWGAEIHTDYHPYEAGLGFAVAIDKGDFIGRSALKASKADGLKRKLCCLTFDDPTVVVMGREPILDGDHVLGYVTSANYGYTVGKSIAYGYLPISHAKPDTKVEIYYFGNRHRAKVVKEPLFDPQNARLKS